MAVRATAFLRDEPELFLADLIVAETIYVLESFYETPRVQVAEIVQSLLALPSIVVVDRDVLLRRSRSTSVIGSISPRPTWLLRREHRSAELPPSIGQARSLNG